MKRLLFCLLWPAGALAVEVAPVPKVAVPIEARVVALPLAAPALAAPKIGVLAPPPSVIVTPSAVKPAPVPAMAAGKEFEVPFDSHHEDSDGGEKESAAAAVRFDQSALRTDSLDAVHAAGSGGSVVATPRGVTVKLESGKKMTLAVVNGSRRDEFSVWKKGDGYRISLRGALSSHAVPEKGFFIFRAPSPAKEAPDRLTIVDKSVPAERFETALTAENGRLVVQDLSRMGGREGVSVLLDDVRPEGAFPIESVLTPSGHAFNGGAMWYRDETVAVDWGRDKALRDYYARVKRRLVREGSSPKEIAALASVFASVLSDVKYSGEAIEERIARLNGRGGVLLGELMGLSGEDSCPAVGVCRHMALLLGAVLERLISEGRPGLAGGKVFYVDGKGHAWAVYRDSRGAYHVLDAAQRHGVVPLDERATYTGEVLDGKGQFGYADDMRAELKRDWLKSRPSRWALAARELSDLASGALSRLRNLMPDRSRKAILRRRLAEITKNRP